MRDGVVVNIISLPISFKEKLLGRSRLLTRLLRFGVRTALPIDENNVIVCIGNTLYEVNIETGSISDGWYCGNGVRPLQLTQVKGITSFDDSLYFGGYLGNDDKKKRVSIYKRKTTDEWCVVYTFPQESINHVHNIIADSYRDCLWVFTGDFGEASAIWKITNNFNTVERIVSNDQKYRACVAFPVPEGLLYATDSPFMDDYICLFNPQSLIVKKLFPIDGSCIYGCQWKDEYVFSSTVEGDGRDMGLIECFFSRKKGAGIKNDFAHIYMGNEFVGFSEVYKEKKDIMPFYTFQFGTFKFPSGYCDDECLYFQPIATKRNDLWLMTFS